MTAPSPGGDRRDILRAGTGPGSRPAALRSAFRKLCHMSKTLDEIEAWLDVSSVQGAGSKLTLDNLDAVVRRERRAGAS